MNVREFSKHFSKGQVISGFVLIALMTLFGFYLHGISPDLPAALVFGLGIGYTLTRSRYGFAGGIKRIYVTGNGDLSVALLVAFVITTAIYGAYHWIDHLKGAVPAFLATEGQDIITGTQNVHFFNIATMIGAFVFGIGMIIAGGCASGTLSDLGEGEMRSALALPFFILSTIPGHYLRAVIDRSAVGKVGVQHYLPQTFGYFGAFVVTLLICFLLYLWVKAYERKRKLEHTYVEPGFDDFEDKLVEPADEPVFGLGLYHRLFCRRWSFKTGSLVLAAISGAFFIFNKKAWGVTSAFTRIAVWFFSLFGVRFQDPSFDGIYSKLEKGILADKGVILNIGIIMGATICFLLASRFKFNRKFDGKNAGLFILGGLLMGFGSRMAKGCNIGALYSAVTNYSTAGWLFTLFISLGAVFALKVFKGGRCSLVPPRHRDPADFK
ncbi:MAG: YeeE/YedE family protein [Eubacteriales bacterium]|nr:YeeE/YedE family protein [Eubacteriales bacterium]